MAISSLSAINFTVGDNYQYSTIQSAVDAAYQYHSQHPQASEMIFIYHKQAGYQESVDLRELDLTLIASQIQTIKASTSNSIIFDATNCENIVINNLKFDGGNFSNVIGVKNSLEIINSAYYDIKNCTFVNLDKGIENCNIAHLNINNCNFSNNKIATNKDLAAFLYKINLP